METPHDDPAHAALDTGYSFVELAVALAVTAVVLVAIGLGLRTVIADGETTACDSEQREVAGAVESWFAMNESDSLPPTGDGPDRYQMTLVEAGLIRSPSTYVDLADDGSLSPAPSSPC